MNESLKLQVGIEVIRSYKRLSYTAWYAFAEFVDNSTQAYINNKSELDSHFEKSGEKLKVDIVYDRELETITITDNSIGMTLIDLSNALRIGIPPENDKARSKYGLGLKTAACWFGDKWTIETKRLGHNKKYIVNVDVEAVASNPSHILPIEEKIESADNHYTIIRIKDLNRHYHGNTLKKVKDFLTSMYRFDFKNLGLILTWQGNILNWEGFDHRFYITQENKPFKQYFEFEIGSPSKKVTGWVGVLSKGSRKDAGFSIIQNNRVIKGWPSAYKPESIFGDQEFGSNDLINQRIVGELFMDGFAVSHTKDSILWQDDEEEELDKMLGELCEEAKHLARNLRVKNLVSELVEDYGTQVLDTIKSELKSSEIRDKLFNESIPEERVLLLSNKRLIEAVKNDNEPVLEVQIGESSESIWVKLYYRSVSEFEPYVVIEQSTEKNTIIVIVNTLHPFWIELNNYENKLNFLRHCIYDGVAEWRALKKTGQINPNTIKFIKDSLLRLSFEIMHNKYQIPED